MPTDARREARLTRPLVRPGSFRTIANRLTHAGESHPINGRIHMSHANGVRLIMIRYSNNILG
jgi:hypothetical protein